jgi:hypothetical protein
MLSFFQPLFLWALAAIAVPIIIHLLFRRKAVRIDFSTLRFLNVTALQAYRRRRLRDLLLLCIRLAILALLALLCAQPYMPQDPFDLLADPHATIYCWIDPTVSMDYRVRGEPLGQRAGVLARQLDSALAPTAERWLWDEQRGVFTRAQTGELSGVIPVPRHGPTDCGVMLSAFAALPTERRGRAMLVLFSDFQIHDSAFVAQYLAADKLPAPLLCVALGEREPWNFSVVSTSFAVEGAPEAHARLSALGRPLKAAGVSVMIGPMRTGAATIDLDKDDSAVVTVPISLPPRATSGTVRLDAADPFPADNIDYFTCDRTEGMRFLVVTDGPESFPVIAALKTLFPKQPLLQRSAAQVSAAECDSADVIVLYGLRAPAPALMEMIAGGNATAGQVILFSPALDDIPAGVSQAVSRLLDPVVSLRREESAQPLYTVLPDTLVSLWRSFPRLEDRNVAVLAYIRPIPGTPLCRLDNGAPLVSNTIDRYGRSWLIFATPLGIDRANNLCETGFFIPLIDRSLRFGRMAIHREDGPWIAGMPRTNPFRGSRHSARVLQEDGRFYAQWESQPTVVIERPGVYTIQPTEDPAAQIAVHMDPAESRIEYRIPEIRGAHRRNLRVVGPDDFVSFITDQRRRSVAVLLWIVLGMLLVAEAVLTVGRIGRRIERRSPA